MVARLLKNKGVYEYLVSSEVIKKQFPNVEFLLAGPRDSEGKNAISNDTILEFSDSVSYLGVREDVPALLALADIFVLPTYYREGVPRVLLEAAAAGTVTVTTDMPGCREVVINEQSGIVVPPRDVNALTEAIIRLIASPTDRQRYCEHAKAIVSSKCDLQQVVESYSEIYDAAPSSKV